MKCFAYLLSSWAMGAAGFPTSSEGKGQNLGIIIYWMCPDALALGPKAEDLLNTLFLFGEKE